MNNKKLSLTLGILDTITAFFDMILAFEFTSIGLKFLYILLAILFAFLAASNFNEYFEE